MIFMPATYTLSPVPEFIDPVFTRKKIPTRSFSVIQNERFGIVFAKTGFIISGTGSVFSILVTTYCETMWLKVDRQTMAFT
jgi:hypothetical protein